MPGLNLQFHGTTYSGICIIEIASTCTFLVLPLVVGFERGTKPTILMNTNYRSSSKMELDIGLRLLLVPCEELGRNARSSLRRRFQCSLNINSEVSNPAPR